MWPASSKPFPLFSLHVLCLIVLVLSLLTPIANTFRLTGRLDCFAVLGEFWVLAPFLGGLGRWGVVLGSVCNLCFVRLWQQSKCYCLVFKFFDLFGGRGYYELYVVDIELFKNFFGLESSRRNNEKMAEDAPFCPKLDLDPVRLVHMWSWGVV